jgi:hypothetical protein
MDKCWLLSQNLLRIIAIETTLWLT